MKTLIYNGQVICDGQRRLNDAYLLFDESGILKVADENIDTYYNDPTVEKVDARGNWVTPGLTDVHTHGANGYDFAAITGQELNVVGQVLVKEGVTSFLASTSCDSRLEMLAMAQRLGAYRYESGARCLGIHMEGPYLSTKYKAIMREELLRPASIKEFQNWQKASGNFVKTITVAPEVSGVLDFIATLSDQVRIMIGHSDASVSQVTMAVKNGARGFTHLYNAMSQHLHRQPGVVTAAFLTEHTYCEMICDGNHIAPEAIAMTIKQMRPERIILISDAMPGKGMADGRFLFCKNWVYKEGGLAHLEGDTKLAGSIMPLNQMCYNVLQWCDCSINDIVQMACVNPNRLLNESKKGHLAPGYDADVCIFNKQLKPLVVYVAGVKQELNPLD